MLIKDPQRLRKMWFFDLINKRLPPVWPRDVHHDCLYLSACLNTCVTKFHGKSLNFCRKDKSCDLNDAERHAHPKYYEGCIYMDVSESPKVCPFNIFPMLKYITNVKNL